MMKMDGMDDDSMGMSDGIDEPGGIRMGVNCMHCGHSVLSHCGGSCEQCGGSCDLCL